MTNLNFNYVRLSIEFEFSKVNDKIMTVDVVYKDRHVKLHPNEPGVYSLELDIDIPNTVRFSFSGKDNRTDTIIVDNKIVDDLCVKIKNISLEGFKVDKPILHLLPKLITESGSTIVSNYIGFNGFIDIEILENNIFDQLMAWHRQYRSIS